MKSCCDEAQKPTSQDPCCATAAPVSIQLDSCCATPVAASPDTCCTPHSLATAAPSTANGRGPQGAMFRIEAMDCAAEESEIRRALESIAGVRGLGFQLGARTLTIDAPDAVIPQALAAIRKAGFDPQPVARGLLVFSAISDGTQS